jgi:hypothetical protein
MEQRGVLVRRDALQAKRDEPQAELFDPGGHRRRRPARRRLRGVVVDKTDARRGPGNDGDHPGDARSHNHDAQAPPRSHGCAPPGAGNHYSGDDRAHPDDAASPAPAHHDAPRAGSHDDALRAGTHDHSALIAASAAADTLHPTAAEADDHAFRPAAAQDDALGHRVHPAGLERWGC